MPRVKEPLSLDKKLKVQVGICRRMLKEVEAYQKEVGRAMHLLTRSHCSSDSLAFSHALSRSLIYSFIYSSVLSHLLGHSFTYVHFYLLH